MEVECEPKEFLKKIVRAIPVGYGGYIIGKKGCFKSQLNTEFGAELYLYNDPLNPSQQIVYVFCPEDQYNLVVKKIDDKISEINKKIGSNIINTITSNPNQLKPTVECGKLIPGFVMNVTKSSSLAVILADNRQGPSYEQMSAAINGEYTDSAPRVPSPISRGCVCIALGSRAKYYRAVVLEYYYDMASVYFVDIGKVELLPSNCLYKIKVKYLELPFRAIPVKWNNCQLNDSFPNFLQVIYRRFMCSQETKLPEKVYFYFTHVDCCVPHVSIYVNKPGCKNHSENDEFVDLLELLTTIGLARTIPSEIVLKKNCRKIESVDGSALFYKPCNYSYYESVMNIQTVEDDQTKEDNNQTITDKKQ